MSDFIRLNAPPSKSVSHRALLASGLAQGRSRLKNVLASEDLLRTKDCLQALGSQIWGEDSRLEVQGIAGNIMSPTGEPVQLDVGESGTTCRLIAAIVSAGRGSFQISGRGRMHQRPIQSLGQSLESQGVVFNYLEQPGCPPVRIETGGLAGGNISVSLQESSQYLSGLLLAGTMARAPLVISVCGDKVVSWPYVHLTLKVMDSFGNAPMLELLQDGAWSQVSPDEVDRVEPGRIRFRIEPGVFHPVDYQVEGDFSNASYLLAAGAAGKIPVLVGGLDKDSRQGDRRILDILQGMGAEVSGDEQGIAVVGKELLGVDLDMGSCPDLVPTVAVLAALARGRTRISNVGHLRIKESDRLAGVKQELERTGCNCILQEDGLVIEPGEVPTGERIEFCTYGDHRMAMSLSLLELAGIRVVLDHPECVNKSFPGFWDQWAEVRRANKISG